METAANTLSQDWRALWLLRSRVLFADLGFWLVLLGWDPRQRRFTNTGYLIYAVIFFALWIFMVLLLLADFAAKILLALPFASPQAAALTVGALGFWFWLLISAGQTLRRSPFEFTDADAQHLCLSPIDRRLVALEWAAEGWAKRALPAWVSAVVLGYALLQATFPREMQASDLPVFLFSGARSFSLALPLSILVVGLAWGLGAWRLRGDRSSGAPGQAGSWLLRALPNLLAVISLLMSLVVGWKTVAEWLLPLALCVKAGLGLANWPAGMGLALALAALGPLAVWRGAQGMSLSRAAQETHDLAGIRAARAAGQQRVADEIAQRRRLGAEHAPSRLPMPSGWGALLWKAVVQGQRRISPGRFIGIAAVFAADLALLTFPNWMTRLGMALGLMLIILQISTAPLARELQRWWLLRSLPFKARSLVTAALVGPVGGLWLAGLAALVLMAFFGKGAGASDMALYLTCTLGAALAGSIDVLRKSKASDLINGSIPSASWLGALIAIAVIALNAGAAWVLLAQFGAGPAFAALNLVIFGGAIDLGLLSLAGEMLKEIE